MRIPFFDVDYDEDSDDDTSYVYKNVFVIGAQKSGKTSIIKRLTKNSFTLYYTPTIAIEIFGKLILGNQVFTFYEVPSTYEFQHKFFIDPAVVCIVDNVETNWWKNFLDMVDPKTKMEVVWVSQTKNNYNHRFFHVNCLANTGFKTLVRAFTNF
jgi:GTPase SAR1 family protein